MGFWASFIEHFYIGDLTPIYNAKWKEALTEVGKDFMNSHIFYFTIFFVVFQPILRKMVGDGAHYRRNRPFWKSFMWSYNVAMSVFSFFCATLCLWEVSKINAMTYPVGKYFTANPRFHSVVQIFYYSKYVEYVDVAFNILRGAEVEFLQWFHHLGAPVNLWLALQYGGDQAWIFVVLNGYIHTIMYWYYAARVSKSDFWLSPMGITSLQLIQFVMGFSLLFPFKNIPEFAADARKLVFYFYTYLYVGGVKALFIKYFIGRYILKNRSKEHKA